MSFLPCRIIVQHNRMSLSAREGSTGKTHTPKYAQIVSSYSRLRRPSNHGTKNNSVFSHDATQTRSTRWPWHCSSCYYCVLRKSSGRATAHILHCCCRATSYQKIILKTFLEKEGNLHLVSHEYKLLLLVHQQKIYLATQYKNRKFKRLDGTKMSILGNEVRLQGEGGHGNCCRFAR